MKLARGAMNVSFIYRISIVYLTYIYRVSNVYLSCMYRTYKRIRRRKNDVEKKETEHIFVLRLFVRFH